MPSALAATFNDILKASHIAFSDIAPLTDGRPRILGLSPDKQQSVEVIADPAMQKVQQITAMATLTDGDALIIGTQVALRLLAICVPSWSTTTAAQWLTPVLGRLSSKQYVREKLSGGTPPRLSYSEVIDTTAIEVVWHPPTRQFTVIIRPR